MTEFKIGQRVRDAQSGRSGAVVEGNYPPYVAVMLDGGGHKTYWYPEELIRSEDPAAPAKPDAKPECYITAWVLDEGFSHTDCATYQTKEEADRMARDLTPDGGPVAVFKMVSKHSSAVTVTSEDV